MFSTASSTGSKHGSAPLLSELSAEMHQGLPVVQYITCRAESCDGTLSFTVTMVDGEEHPYEFNGISEGGEKDEIAKRLLQLFPANVRKRRAFSIELDGTTYYQAFVNGSRESWAPEIKTFTSKSALDAHLSVVHGGQWYGNAFGEGELKLHADKGLISSDVRTYSQERIAKREVARRDFWLHCIKIIAGIGCLFAAIVAFVLWNRRSSNQPLHDRHEEGVMRSASPTRRFEGHEWSPPKVTEPPIVVESSRTVTSRAVTTGTLSNGIQGQPYYYIVDWDAIASGSTWGSVSGLPAGMTYTNTSQLIGTRSSAVPLGCDFSGNLACCIEQLQVAVYRVTTPPFDLVGSYSLSSGGTASKPKMVGTTCFIPQSVLISLEARSPRRLELIANIQTGNSDPGALLKVPGKDELFDFDNNGGSCTISHVNTVTNSVTATANLSGKPCLGGVIYGPHLFVSGGSGATDIPVLTTSPLAPTTPISLTGVAGMATQTGGGTTWLVAARGANGFSTIDPVTMLEINTFATSVGYDPTGVAVDGAYVYFRSAGGFEVFKLDTPSSATPVQTVSVPNPTLSLSAYKGRIYVTTLGNNYHLYSPGHSALTGEFGAGATGSVTLTFTPGDGPGAGSEHERTIPIDPVIDTVPLPPTEAINGKAFTYSAGVDVHKTGLETVITVEECTDQTLTTCSPPDSWLRTDSKAKTLSGIVPGTGASSSFLKIGYFSPFGSTSTEPLDFKVGTPPVATTNSLTPKTVTGGIVNRVQLPDVFTGEGGYTVTMNDAAKTPLDGSNGVYIDASTTPPTVVVESSVTEDVNLLYSGIQAGSTISKTLPYQIIVESATAPTERSSLPSFAVEAGTTVSRRLAASGIFNGDTEIAVTTDSSWVSLQAESDAVTVIAHPGRSDTKTGGNGRATYCVTGRPAGLPETTTITTTLCQSIDATGLSELQRCGLVASFISFIFTALSFVWLAHPYAWNCTIARCFHTEEERTPKSIKHDSNCCCLSDIEVTHQGHVVRPEDGAVYPISGISRTTRCCGAVQSMTAMLEVQIPGKYSLAFRQYGGTKVSIHDVDTTKTRSNGHYSADQLKPIQNGNGHDVALTTL